MENKIGLKMLRTDYSFVYIIFPKGLSSPLPVTHLLFLCSPLLCFSMTWLPETTAEGQWNRRYEWNSLPFGLGQAGLAGLPHPTVCCLKSLSLDYKIPFYYRTLFDLQRRLYCCFPHLREVFTAWHITGWGRGYL